MQKTTNNPKDTKDKKAAPYAATFLLLLCVAVFCLVPLLAGVLAITVLLAREGQIWIVLFLLLFLSLRGSRLIGLLKVLAERLRELNKGEEEDAKNYEFRQ